MNGSTITAWRAVPTTSDGRSTSVGIGAAVRFTRAVCYQGFVDEAIPDELKDANPRNIWRMIDGRMTKDALSADLGLANSSAN